MRSQEVVSIPDETHSHIKLYIYEYGITHDQLTSIDEWILNSRVQGVSSAQVQQILSRILSSRDLLGVYYLNKHSQIACKIIPPGYRIQTPTTAPLPYQPLYLS
jgi:hypothetical protein